MKTLTWREMSRVLRPGHIIILSKPLRGIMSSSYKEGTRFIVHENGLNEIWCMLLVHEPDSNVPVTIAGPDPEGEKPQWDQPCELFQLVNGD